MDLTTVLVFVVVFLVSYFLYTRPKNLPPGPLGLPVLGSFFLVNQFRHERPHKVLFEASKKYGNVMKFWLGKELFVVLSGYDAVHEALVKQADVFSDRPLTKTLDRGEPNASEYQDRSDFLAKMRNGGIIFQHHGSTWRMLRRFTLQTLRDFGVGKTSLEEKIFTELDVISKALQDSNGRPIDTSNYTQKLVGNVLIGIVFGKRYDYDDPQFDRIRKQLIIILTGSGDFSFATCLPQFFARLVSKMLYTYTRYDYDDPQFDKIRQMLTILLTGTGSFSIATSLPKIIARLVSKKDTDNDKLRVDASSGIRKYIADEIEEHEKTFDRDNIRDFVDIYLKTKQDANADEEDIDMANMFRVIMDLFIAGSETTYTTLDWALLYMSEYPQIQAKCQKEILEMFGEKHVEYNTDRGKMPYLEATLMEVQRKSMIVGLNVTHCTSRDTTLFGYNIPAGTSIMASLYSVTHDPKYWQQPEKFWPERFLDDAGQLVKNEAFMPFSTGPRVCLGEPLAKMELFLVFTTLLQRFTFRREKDGIPHSLEPKQYHITNVPTPYKLKVFRRN